MLPLKKYIALATCSLLLVGCASLERLAIPESALIDTALQETGFTESINHAAWNKFLKENTTTDNQGVVRVAYKDVSPIDHQNLKNYIQMLASIDTKALSRNAQLAYWANLYNAQTVDVILDHYPVSSIRKIKDGFFDLGPWDNKRLNIAGKKLSLHDIEHGIVRPLWQDTPEVHYLLNCAAAGCPNLSLQAFQADTIENVMRNAATDYVNNSRGVVVFDDGSIAVSKIYSWYIDDFGGSQQSILDHINQYAGKDLKEKLFGTKLIQQYFYDWSLNDTKFFNRLIIPKNQKEVSYN